MENGRQTLFILGPVILLYASGCTPDDGSATMRKESIDTEYEHNTSIFSYSDNEKLQVINFIVNTEWTKNGFHCANEIDSSGKISCSSENLVHFEDIDVDFQSIQFTPLQSNTSGDISTSPPVGNIALAINCRAFLTDNGQSLQFQISGYLPNEDFEHLMNKRLTEHSFEMREYFSSYANNFIVKNLIFKNIF